MATKAGACPASVQILVPAHEKLLSWVSRQIYTLKSFSFQTLESFSGASKVLTSNFGTLPVFSLDVQSANRMIINLSNGGCLVSAREVFDEMHERDVVSWNSMMTAYSRNECYEEVLQLFSELQRFQLKPNYTSLSTVLSSCGKVKALVLGRTIHGFSIKAGASANLFVGTSLITMYSRCGAADCLSNAFESINHPNTASWNALIFGFVLNHQVTNARKVFDRMPRRNVVSWTTMVNGYAEIKKMRIASELFESMPVKNHVSWCVMLRGLVNCRIFNEALVLFTKMLNSGVTATAASIIEVIKACSGMGNITQGCTIHGCIIKLGFQLYEIIEATLVSMYCDCLDRKEADLEFRKMEMKYLGTWNSLLCGYINRSSCNINDARKLFDSMESRDNLTWNLMINGYLKTDRLDEALKLFRMMSEPTIEAYTALMYSFIMNGNMEEAEKLFHLMPERDAVAYTTLLFGYLKYGWLDEAVELFNKMPDQNVVSYNVMISGLLHGGKTKEAYDLFRKSPVKDDISWGSIVIGFVQNGLFAEAIQLYKNMLLFDVKPSELIIASLLKASAKLSLMILGEQIHGILVKLGYEFCLNACNSLISMYGKCGNILMANFVFDCMARHDVVTWNALIHSYACNGFGKEAVEKFEKMKIGKVKPNDITFLSILFACNHNSLWEEAHGYFNSMVHDYGIKPSVAHYACLIDLLCRVGMVAKAEELAHSMPHEPDSTIWTSILSGSRLHCDVKLAGHAANRLFLWDPLDRMPYMHLISIYISAGQWADVARLRSKLNGLMNARPAYSWI